MNSFFLKFSKNKNMVKAKSLPRKLASLRSGQTNEIRKAYLLNKYVIITPGRLARPRDIKEQTIIKRMKACPFCPANIIKKNIVDRINSKKN